MALIKNYIIFIKEIFSQNWKYGDKTLYFAIFISISLISYYHLNLGFVMSSDSGSYSEWADILIKLNFNLYKYYSQNTFINPNYIYTIPVLIIAILKILFEAKWQFAFMSLNLVLVFFSLVIFSKSLLILKVRPLIISLALLLITISVDLLTWPRYILTDMIFSFFIILIIHITIKGIENEKLNYLGILFLIILIYLTRPTSLPFIFAIVFFISMLRFKIINNPKLIFSVIFIFTFLTPFTLALIFQLMKFHFIDIPQIFFLIEMVEVGMIIHDRPETWVEIPQTYLDVVLIYFLRFIYFFSPYAESFSVIHTILNSLQTLLIIVSIFIWLILKTNFKSINKTIVLILFISFFVAVFHSFTLIDYDWRYRFPLIVPVIIIFPLSFEILLRKIEVNNIK